MENLETRYNEIPYLTSTRRKSSPDRMAVVASLLGLDVPDPDTARILEIGCGTGEHITAIASSLPNSFCLGIDLSTVQINMGQALIDELCLKNIDLRALDFTKLKEEKFDYIIAHGVLSWIPAEQQSKFLKKIHQHLSSKGVAYISYNTYPGWYERKTIRDLMLNATLGINDTSEKVDLGLSRLKETANALKDDKSAYAQSIREHEENFRNLPKWYITHEFMAIDNNPFYFIEFCELLKLSGLEFLGEVTLDAMVPSNFSPPMANILEKEKDTLKREQTADFFLNRSFRESLVRHETSNENLVIAPRAVTKMWMRAAVQRDKELDEGISKGYTFSNGTSIALIDKAHTSGLDFLGKQWPRAVSFVELAAITIEKENIQSSNLASLAKFLSNMFTKNLIELFFSDPGVMPFGGKPKTERLAQVQILKGSLVTNRVFENVLVNNETCAKLISVLNGKRESSELASILGLEQKEVDNALEKLAQLSLLTNT